MLIKLKVTIGKEFIQLVYNIIGGTVSFADDIKHASIY